MKAKGFTLIELLVVITIIGILATGATAVYSGAQAKARDAQRQNDVGTVYSAQTYNAADSNAFAVAVASLAKYMDDVPSATGLKSDSDSTNVATSSYHMTANTSTSQPRLLVGACGMQGTTVMYVKSSGDVGVIAEECETTPALSGANLDTTGADTTVAKGTFSSF